MAILNHFLLSFLVTSTLAITIPPAPVWPSGRCTDKSLTIPSWILSNYKVVAGTATFQVLNRASESTSFIECKSGKEKCNGSAGSSEISATWKKGEDGKPVVSISDSWYCTDAGDRTIFEGSGSTTITSCEGDNCVSPITYRALGTLTLPVPLTPVQPSAPPGFDAPTCATVGKNQWQISNIEYKNVTKSQCNQWYEVEGYCLQPPTGYTGYVRRGQYLSFDVTNHAIPQTVRCSFAPTYNNNNLPSVLRCSGGGNFNEITLDVSWSGSAPNFNLKVEQLWYCLDPLKSVNPDVIVASGSTSVPLTCSSTNGITGTPDDIITTCTDPVSSHPIDGTQDVKQSLPPYSLVTAYPVNGGCTFDSVIKPTWYYRAMAFETRPYPENDPNSATLAYISAGLSGPGFDNFFFFLNKAISGSGVDTVYTCAVYYDGKPKDQHWNCTYALNPQTKVITQEKTWPCSDKNADQPIYFSGSGIFDWTVDPVHHCSKAVGPNTSLKCAWNGTMAWIGRGVPFGVPKVRASLVNVLPPDYGMPLEAVNGKAATGVGDTIRVDGEWKLA